MLLKTILVSFSALFLSNISSFYDSVPLESEKLSEKIQLQKDCSNIQIVEWQDRSNSANLQQKIIQDVCEKTIKSFPKFLIKQNKKCNKNSENKISISLLRDGSNFRELNDLEFRFSKRTKEYDVNGKPFEILGYYQFNINHIFIYNQITKENNKPNDQFKTVFAHELFHAMNYNCNLSFSFENEEKEARKFTSFIGLGE